MRFLRLSLSLSVHRYENFAKVWVQIEVVFAANTLAKVDIARLPIVGGTNPWWNHDWINLQVREERDTEERIDTALKKE